MGSSSSKLPVTSKFTLQEENNRIKYAASSMQGWRPYMEDTRTAILDLDGSKSTSFFGVYDGHGGSTVAMYCASRFHIELFRDDDYQNDPAAALERVFFRIDEQLLELDDWRALVIPRPKLDLISCIKATLGARFRNPAKETPYMEGSTACVALIRGNQIIVGNVGDSRCVLSRDGQAIDLSTDHKPTIREEHRRITRAGGKVVRDELPRWLSGKVVGKRYGTSRVNGNLSMSRAIGDFAFKNNKCLRPEEQMVTCNPDIHTVYITDDTEFLVIASDGIWDIMGSQNVVDFVHKNLQDGETDLRAICERLINRSILSRDNITVILVQFKHINIIPDPSSTLTTTADEAAMDTSSEIIEVKDVLPSTSTSRITEVGEVGEVDE